MNHAGTFRAASLLVLVSLTTSACSEVNLPTAASTRFPLQQRYSIRNDVKRHAKYFQYDDSGSNWAHDEDPITIGPDGNPWFGEIETGQVGRINHDGTITKFLVGTETSFPGAITTGADRNLWVVAAGYPAMVRVTPNGKMSFFSIPSGINQGDITVGSDRELWFAMPGAKSVGRVTLKGGFTQYSLGNDDSSGALTTGADGYVWVGLKVTSGGRIARIAPSGKTVGIVNLPLEQGFLKAFPVRLTLGTDKHVWLIEQESNYYASACYVERLSNKKVLAKYEVPGNCPNDIESDPNGNLWLALAFNGQSGTAYGYFYLMSPTGRFRTVHLPPIGFDKNADPFRIAFDPRTNHLWFTNWFRFVIGRTHL